MSDPWYVCDICGQDFGVKDELEEHLVYNHDALNRHITVRDDANAGPEGL